MGPYIEGNVKTLASFKAHKLEAPLIWTEQIGIDFQNKLFMKIPSNLHYFQHIYESIHYRPDPY